MTHMIDIVYYEQLQRRNKQLQATLDDIQAVAIDPLQAEMNRIRKGNKDFRNALNNMKAMAIDPLVVEINRLREENKELDQKLHDREADCHSWYKADRKLKIELSDINDALQLHQTSGDFEAGQIYADKVIGAEVERLREENTVWRKERDANRVVIDELREENDTIHRLRRAEENGNLRHRGAMESLQEEKRKLQEDIEKLQERLVYFQRSERAGAELHDDLQREWKKSREENENLKQENKELLEKLCLAVYDGGERTTLQDVISELKEQLEISHGIVQFRFNKIQYILNKKESKENETD